MKLFDVNHLTQHNPMAWAGAMDSIRNRAIRAVTDAFRSAVNSNNIDSLRSNPQKFHLHFFRLSAYTEYEEISDFSWAGRRTQVHQWRGSSPPFLSNKPGRRLPYLHEQTFAGNERRTVLSVRGTRYCVEHSSNQYPL